ncbi:transcription-repair-coupling factor [Kurthia zopfii]|uniref:Transcription-repair-coupling factor n=1 Tax=Kurthia zopfii TaxID=1650 RepID=A0A2U3ABG2_9BACL|nr:transcription-repair coupling factor [Kurthia zopfii]PWI21886.1 transcription-repair coupling factor [Kurthia zopfii]TDR36086.1 transcription-repair coupling factor [Kurthia zopfii]STX08424.1 Transcription-repair-coupling factor [Kurthia zopfii]VEI05329.1 Transcription-repair-coupling factor [Kurthia zopfii]GEK31023.1 transcription-repair-coupling factor [Kurthia zopfii]
MEILHQLFMNDAEIEKFINDLKNGQRSQLVTGLSGSARPTMIGTAFEETKKSMYIIAPNMLQAQNLYEDLSKLIGEELVHYYPADEFIAADMTVASPELRAQRIETINHMLNDQRGIYIIPAAGMRKIMPPKDLWKELNVQIELGEELDTELLLSNLVTMGYSRNGMVTTPGEFALRGGIIDIYPPYYENPVRIELFDTEVDSIRTFSADDQRSIDKLTQLTILPASEFVLSKENRVALALRLEDGLAQSLKQVQSDSVKTTLLENVQSDITLLKEGQLPEFTNRYGSLLYENPTFLGDYFQKDGVVIFEEIARIQEVMDAWEKEEKDWMLEMIEIGKMVHSVKPSFSFQEILANIPQQKVFFTLFTRGFTGIKFTETYNFSCKPMQHFHGQIDLLQSEIKRWQSSNFTVIFMTDVKERTGILQDLLEEHGVKVQIGTPNGAGVFILSGHLTSGFELPMQKIAVVTEEELFKQQKKRKTRPKTMTNAERIKSYTEIKPGDYIVHVHHGIGKYIGIETLEINGNFKDYLQIRYRADDKLFVPIDQIDLIQKYVGSEDKEPKLHKLGGVEWKKTKTKVAKAVQDIADDLIKLYAEREAAKGFAFSPDDAQMREFEESFPYEETEDQLRTIQEVKIDMERERPMDRLVCGDVGYGKTEVAIRAAHKAVLDGKQVAFLVPTTILAQQHYETMIERFQDTPVNIGVLSRFRSKKQQNETLAALHEGKIDILVGTHRILSKDVAYKDLGLLIVDEEQRFGVTHKEKIKTLKTNVDVLTLTATPIPRTLHMSMVGVRDLSVIETPPANRFPVQTYVMEHNGALIREAIEREMARGGQVFYLHNRVDDMGKQIDLIQTLVPEARIARAHGKMTESELESVILAFLDGEYDVLVTTTIIETGIDIPNVNTLIVNNADRMGLSQLYQLRGRVGRSNRVAYAYFMYQRDKVLTEVAEQRLQAVKEFTELGSGFKIAMRDLSIRGAGNLLGAQQHGFIDSVGFDLYSQMLEEAVEEKQTGEKKVEEHNIEILIPFDAYLPDEYIPDGYQKIQMYKRIRSIQTEKDYSEIIDELVDRFGDLPTEVDRLMRIARMKAWGKEVGLNSVKYKNKMYKIELSPEGTAQIDGSKMVSDSMSLGRAVGFTMENNMLALTVDERKVSKSQDLFELVEAVVKLLPDALKE